MNRPSSTAPATTSQGEQHSFQLVRWGGFFLLISCLIIGFFHRFAPAAFAGTLTREFGTSAAALGTLAALNFYVYTAMQIPSGALIDRLGTRICVSAGTLAAAAGSVVFALAPNLAVAYLGPLLMGLGASAVFVGIMKGNTLWFSPAHYGVMAGVTMLLANVGSIAAAGPSAVLLHWFDWRTVFLAVGALALLLAVGVYLLVHDRPEDAGFAPLAPAVRRPSGLAPRRSLLTDLKEVAATRGLWPVFWAAIGTNATFYAFAGLWGVPLLTDGFGLSNASAAVYTTLGLAGYGLASFAVGLYSDRLGRRKPPIVAASAAALGGWLALAVLPWGPGWSGLLLYMLVGLGGCQVVVAFANVKELVPARIAATALAVLNFGVFLGAAIIEPVFGMILDHLWDGRLLAGIRQYEFSDYRTALWLPVGVSLFGLLASLRSRETYCQDLTEPTQFMHNAPGPARAASVPVHGSSRTAPVRPHRPGGRAVVRADRALRDDGCGHQHHAGAADPATGGRHRAAPAPPDVRPLRGAGAAELRAAQQPPDARDG